MVETLHPMDEARPLLRDTQQRQDAVRALRHESHSIRTITKALGISPATVQRDLVRVSCETGETAQPDTTIHDPPRLYAGVFWKLLPRVLQGERVDSLITLCGHALLYHSARMAATTLPSLVVLSK